MTAVSERQQRVAASFTRQYYTLMVQQPEKLPAFYTPHATFDHMGHKAEGTAEIETTIAALYPVQPNGSAQIHSLSVETTANGNTHVTIKGSITTALNVTYNFTHDVELTEHKTQPGSFGIVSDKRERAIKEEALQRWALETPPMFAQESRKDAMEPIEQPATTTAVRALEKSPSKKSVEPLKKAESPASEKVAAVNATVRESSANVTAASVSPDSCVAASATDATLETVSDKKLEEEGTTPTPSTSAANTEPKKPKSFAEAILMAKRNAGAQGHATPLKVVAKGGKDQSTEEPVKEKKEKNRDSAAVAERNGTKVAHRNGTNVKKPSTATTSAEGEKKNGKPNAVSGNNKEGGSNTNNTTTTTTTKNNTNHNNNHSNNNNNNNASNNNNNNKNNKRKDAEGRTLSRFVVFYDIIVKGLPHDATEETVREIIGTSAPVKLVNVRSQSDKKDPGVLRTFAFVQLDHNALKEAGEDVKATVAKIVSAHKGKKGPAGQRYQIDEVREKYTAVPAEASA